MTTLKFKNKEQADTIAGILDFSLTLIEPKSIKEFNKEMYQFALALKNDLIYQQDEEVMYLKDDEVLFVLDNAIWILSQEIKTKVNQVYSNSIGLMKQLQTLIQDKKKVADEKRFTTIGDRKFDEKLEEFYSKSCGKDFLINNSYIFKNDIKLPEHKLPVMPKLNEIWILKEYKKADEKSEIGELEDSVLIVPASKMPAFL